MFFKAVDRFFIQLKYLISIIIFILIAMSSLLLIYWFLYSAQIVLPEPFVKTMWSIIDFFAQSFKGTPLYNDTIPILPVLASGVFIVLTYIANCLMLFLENNHNRFKNTVQSYKSHLENTINKELKASFINELKKTGLMLVKIKIEAISQTSYLTAMTDEKSDSKEIEKQILNKILSSVRMDSILKKGISDSSAYFVLADLSTSKEFFLMLVSNSAKLISEHIKSKMKIDFCCAADVFENLTECEKVSSNLSRITSLKLPNKIVVTPRFKILFDNLFSDFFSFKVEGEYNLSPESEKLSNTMLHSLQRKI